MEWFLVDGDLWGLGKSGGLSKQSKSGNVYAANSKTTGVMVAAMLIIKKRYKQSAFLGVRSPLMRSGITYNECVAVLRQQTKDIRARLATESPLDNAYHVERYFESVLLPCMHLPSELHPAT